MRKWAYGVARNPVGWLPNREGRSRDRNGDSSLISIITTTATSNASNN